MKEDIAISEVRASRQRISESHGHDTKRLLDHYREMEKRFNHRIIEEHPPKSAPGADAGRKETE